MDAENATDSSVVNRKRCKICPELLAILACSSVWAPVRGLLLSPKLDCSRVYGPSHTPDFIVGNLCNI